MALAAALGAMLVVLALTLSRSGFAGATVGLIVLTWGCLDSSRSRRQRLAILCTEACLASLLLTGAVTLLPKGASAEMLDPALPQVDSFGARKEIWASASAMIAAAPLNGIGLGQFDHQIDAHFPSVNFARDASFFHAHSIYLQTALDLGIPGALGWLYLIGTFFRRCRQLARADSGEARAIGLGMAAAMVAFLSFGITDAIALGARGDS